MSLRTRLIAALIVLATAGLVTLAAVTYAEQRSFLLDRVDQQARDAQRAVSFELAGGGFPGPAIRRPPPLIRPGVRGGAPPGPPAPPGAPADGDNDGGGSGPQGLPRGTVGQIRTSSGAVIDSTAVRSYGDAALPAPELPAKIQLGEPITVGAKGSELRYRVLAEPTHDRAGFVTVVAVPLREADAIL